MNKEIKKSSPARSNMHLPVSTVGKSPSTRGTFKRLEKKNQNNEKQWKTIKNNQNNQKQSKQNKRKQSKLK